MKIPCFFVKTTFAMMGTAGHEQGNTNPGTVCHINALDITIIHNLPQILEMKYAGFDFFCLSDIPEILSQITACTASNIHFRMVFVSTLWTFPFVVIVDDDFSVVIAYMAVVGFCIELAVLDVVVDEADNLLECF